MVQVHYVREGAPRRMSVARSTLPWVRTALAGRSPSESPFAAFMKMSELR